MNRNTKVELDHIDRTSCKFTLYSNTVTRVKRIRHPANGNAQLRGKTTNVA